jgi:hypothetical protein
VPLGDEFGWAHGIYVFGFSGSLPVDCMACRSSSNEISRSCA